ncbi:hypothetical protein BAE44_0004520 [Dichanthelium oligosanthes]|uniref:Uncharacterized protein n=1 Tax=Dichanthelium oligosanthes TaxID=888268 RepID=A0A1E5WAN6_9POAL|nr:hypothetical protein BAE44_0004520 [Dichanthelium oligosanthes]
MNFYLNMIQASSSQPPPPVEIPAPHTAIHGQNPAVQPPLKQTRRKTPATKTKCSNFTIPEDQTLVSCWLNASLDPITANGQRKGSFWKTVVRIYTAQKGDNVLVRSLQSPEGRWSEIKEQVGKFEAYYNHVINEKRNGYVDDDRGTPYRPGRHAYGPGWVEYSEGIWCGARRRT